jgi:hypothetical protein
MDGVNALMHEDRWVPVEIGGVKNFNKQLMRS